jgi:hypothetical protein
MRRLRAVGAAAECATSSSLSSLPSAMRTFFFGAGLDDALVSTAQFGCEARQWRSRTMRFCCTQDANLSHQLHQPFCKSSLASRLKARSGAVRIHIGSVESRTFHRMHIFCEAFVGVFQLRFVAKFRFKLNQFPVLQASLGFRRLPDSGET